MLNNNVKIMNESKIPQNKEDFYIIETDEQWKHTLNITIKWGVEINTFNLYLIIKSYSSSIIYPVSKFLVRIIKPHDLIISEVTSTQMIRLFNFSEFEKWFFYRIKHDAKYVDDKSIYAFSFTYNYHVFDNSILEKIKPIYPWKPSILEEIKNIETKEYVNEELIKYYKNTVKKLEKDISDLREKVSNKNPD